MWRCNISSARSGSAVPKSELRPLSEAAAVAVQRQMSQTTGMQAGHAGITRRATRQAGRDRDHPQNRQDADAVALVQATTKMAPKPEPAAAETLPATTEECLDAGQGGDQAGQSHAGAGAAQKGQRAARRQNADVAGVDRPRPGLLRSRAGRRKSKKRSSRRCKYDPEELASQFNAALGYQLNDKYDLALATYLKANKINPKHPKVWCNLGVLYFQTDQYPQAESALRFATMASPDYARAWDNLAAALGAQDKLDEALIACQQRGRVAPGIPRSLLQDGRDLFHAEMISPMRSTEFQRAALLSGHRRLLRVVPGHDPRAARADRGGRGGGAARGQGRSEVRPALDGVERNRPGVVCVGQFSPRGHRLQRGDHDRARPSRRPGSTSASASTRSATSTPRAIPISRPST